MQRAMNDVKYECVKKCMKNLCMHNKSIGFCAIILFAKNLKHLATL